MRLDRWQSYLSGTLAGIGALVLVYLMGATSLDVILRSSTGDGLDGVVEYSEILMVALVYLGLGQAQRTDSHIAVDVLVRRLPPVWEKWATIVGLAISIALLGFLAMNTVIAAFESYDSGAVHYGIAAVPLWPAKAAIPVGFVVMGLECLIQAAQKLGAPAERTRSGSLAHA